MQIGNGGEHMKMTKYNKVYVPIECKPKELTDKCQIKACRYYHNMKPPYDEIYKNCVLLASKRPMGLSDIAKILGVSKQRIDQLLKKALIKTLTILLENHPALLDLENGYKIAAWYDQLVSVCYPGLREDLLKSLDV